MPLSGKRVLVTGAARGIGAACAFRLATDGASCICADIGDSTGTVERVRAGGGQSFEIKCDVSNEESVLLLFEDLKRMVGGLDVLVHCAGVIHEKPLLSTSAAEFDRVVSTNLRGTFLVGREAIRVMEGSGGRVILIASDLSYSGRETFSAYAASKHGVLGLVRCWAKEFAPEILVNAICPGPVDTDMLSASNMSLEWRKKETNIPLMRLGRPGEIAGLAAYLAGDESGFVTGQGLGINGGSVMP